MKAQLVALGLVAAIAGAPAQLAAAPAQSEITLHITARGEVQADEAEFSVPMFELGVDAASAEAKLHESERRIVEELGVLGIEPGDIEISDPVIETSDMSDAATAAYMAAEAAAEAVEDAASDSRSRKRRKKDEMALEEPIESSSATSTMTVTVRSMDVLIEAASAAGASLSGPGGPKFVYKDEAGAHRKAIAAAIASARAEADAYADAMGYRVVRVGGVSNTEAPLSLSEIMQTVSRMMRLGRGGESAFMATHFAAIAVDYVIAPK